MPNPILILVALLAALLACWGSYRHGRSVEAGEQALQRQQDIIATASAARADVSTQARASSSALRKADSAERRVREVDREAAQLPARAECDWTGDELQLAQARWCARYADLDPAACKLPDGVPISTDEKEPPIGVGTTN